MIGEWIKVNKQNRKTHTNEYEERKKKSYWMVLRVCIISQFKLHTLSTVSAVMETVVEYEQFYGMQWNAQSFTLFNATTFMITVIELKAKQSINKNTDKWTFTQIKIYADEIYFKIKWFLNTTRQFKTNNFRPKKAILIREKWM